MGSARALSKQGFKHFDTLQQWAQIHLQLYATQKFIFSNEPFDGVTMWVTSWVFYSTLISGFHSIFDNVVFPEMHSH